MQSNYIGGNVLSCMSLRCYQSHLSSHGFSVFILALLTVLIFFHRHLQLSAPSPGSCNGSYLSWHLSQSLLKQKTCHSHQLIVLVPLSGRTYLNQRRKKHLWIYLSKLHFLSNMPIHRDEAISLS